MNEEENVLQPLVGSICGDVPRLFVHSRVLDDLVERTGKYMESGGISDRVAQICAERYESLREEIVAMLNEGAQSLAEQLMPSLTSDAAIEEVNLAAGQAAACLDALADAPGYVVQQQLANVAAQKASHEGQKALRELSPAGIPVLQATGQAYL